MRVQIVARHCEVPLPVRERTEEQIRKLSRYDPQLSAAEVVFTEERHLKRVEGILSLDGEEPAVAQGENPELRAAADQMVDRLGKILRRRRSQARRHQGPSLSEVVAPVELASEE